jgi:serine/threonine protein kinase
MAKFSSHAWEIIRDLSEGGQSWTHVVKRKPDPNDTHHDETEYVLKRLKNPSRLDRFEREIEATTRLNHSNIVRIVDHSLNEGRPYIVTEYCHGGTIANAIPYWRSDPVATLVVFEQILDAVHAAHSNGVLHRDIKPDNIFLKSVTGPPVIGDFGLSIFLDAESRITATQEAVGPRLYMAPELESGRSELVTTASDIYSLGKLLYWLFTGKVFSREAHCEKQWDIKQYWKDPFSPDGDPILEHVNFLLDLMVAKDPNDRRDSANLLILTRQAQALIRRRSHYLSKSIKHECSFCGRGTYYLHTDNDPTKADRFGLRSTPQSSWRIMICNECGHVQLFNFRGQNGWE